MNTFGERLRELRKQQGMSQRELAQRVHLDFTYLSKIETGNSEMPGAFAIHRIAHELSANEEELLGLAGKVPLELKTMMQDNPCFAELIYVLSKHKLSDEIYRHFIALAKDREKAG